MVQELALDGSGSDVVSLHDGADEEDDIIYNLYSAFYQDLPLALHSSTSSLYIHFTTDSFNVGNGFLMTWSFLGIWIFITNALLLIDEC